jgi:hypothetical protein
MIDVQHGRQALAPAHSLLHRIDRHVTDAAIAKHR